MYRLVSINQVLPLSVQYDIITLTFFSHAIRSKSGNSCLYQLNMSVGQARLSCCAGDEINTTYSQIEHSISYLTMCFVCLQTSKQHQNQLDHLFVLRLLQMAHHQVRTEAGVLHHGVPDPEVTRLRALPHIHHQVRIVPHPCDGHHSIVMHA